MILLLVSLNIIYIYKIGVIENGCFCSTRLIADLFSSIFISQYLKFIYSILYAQSFVMDIDLVDNNNNNIILYVFVLESRLL